MTTWIAWLRGINVGGKNKLPMKALVADLEGLGLTAVRTYIQSGNVVFRAAETDAEALSTSIAGAIEAGHGFRPRVLVLTAEAIDAAMAANPFPEGEADPKTLHLFFCSEPATAADLDRMARLQAPSERFQVAERVAYLHAPDGIGRSKLAARMESALGVPATARNWRTVAKVAAMAAAIGSVG